MTINSLFINHAVYADKARVIKREMGAELDQCKHNDFEEVITTSDLEKNPDIFMGTCLNVAYYAKKIMDSENPESYEYDEVLQNYGCEHCNKARDLKLEHGKLKTRLGQIRSAITKVGRKLNKETQWNLATLKKQN